MITFTCECGNVQKYRTEAAQLRDMPNSVMYCKKCGRPLFPDDIENTTKEKATDVRR
jgi:RNase P subunit RPR2